MMIAALLGLGLCVSNGPSAQDTRRAVRKELQRMSMLQGFTGPYAPTLMMLQDGGIPFNMGGMNENHDENGKKGQRSRTRVVGARGSSMTK